MKLNARNFFLNVSDLQGICTALGLPTDDLKPQLIGRILNFASMSNTDDNDEYDDAETDETLINTASMSTQTEEITNNRSNIIPQNRANFSDRVNLKWIFAAGFVVFVVAVLIFWLNNSEAKIEIVVKRPWQPWF